VTEHGQRTEPDDARKKPRTITVVAAVSAIFGLIAAIAVFSEHVQKIWDQAKTAVVWTMAGDEIPLRDTRKEYNRVDGAALPWRKPYTYEVLVETIAGRRGFKYCGADLNVDSRQGSYAALNFEGREDLQDIPANGLMRFKFYLPMRDFPKKAQFRLRCENGTSVWTDVRWPIEAD
jgi:hypothetical protein